MVSSVQKYEWRTVGIDKLSVKNGVILAPCEYFSNICFLIKPPVKCYNTRRIVDDYTKKFQRGSQGSLQNFVQSPNW